MPKPVCVKCNRFYRCKTNGVRMVEWMPDDANTPAGQPKGWNPYKIWFADLWECEGCGHQALYGAGREPVARNFNPGFEDWRDPDDPRPLFNVYDC